MENIKFSRGDVVFVSDSKVSARNHVISGNHPAVIVQNDKANATSPNLIVAYITSQLKRLDLPTHVVLQHYSNLKPCVVLTEQLTTIDKGDVICFMEHLRDEDMARVDRGILSALELMEV